MPSVYYGVGTDHRFHAAMTLLTCGLWAPVWLLRWALNGFR